MLVAPLLGEAGGKVTACGVCRSLRRGKRVKTWRGLGGSNGKSQPHKSWRPAGATVGPQAMAMNLWQGHPCGWVISCSSVWRYRRWTVGLIQEWVSLRV